MHFYEGQFSTEHDEPEANTTTKTIVIASTPRCGSHMLGHSMIATRALGYPFEYCNPVNIRNWNKLLNTETFSDMLAKLKQRRTSRNGVFAVKVHFEHIKTFGTFSDLLNALPNPYFVVLEREDLLAQAISYAKARQTGVWIDGQRSSGTKPSFDFTLVDNCLRKLSMERAGWTFYLQQHGCRTLRLTYEEIRGRMRGTLKDIARFADVAIDPARLPDQPVTTRQSGTGGDKEDWAARYRAELATRQPKPFRAA